MYPVLRFYLETDTTWGYGRALAALSGQPRCLLTLLEPGQLPPLLRAQAVPLWGALVTPARGGLETCPAVSCARRNTVSTSGRPGSSAAASSWPLFRAERTEVPEPNHGGCGPGSPLVLENLLHTLKTCVLHSSCGSCTHTLQA